MITRYDRLCYAYSASNEEVGSFQRDRSVWLGSSWLLQQYKNLNFIFSTTCGKRVQKLRGL
jgi:hypothetical protein